MKKFISLFVLSLIIILASSCDKTSTQSGNSSVQTSQSASKQTESNQTETNNTPEKILNISITGDPTSLDPNSVIGDTWMFTVGHLYEPVTRLDEKNNAVPGMALDWTLSDDGLTYVFTIRDDNGWSNGAPATAADFEYGVKRILTHEAGDDWASLVFDIKNAQKVFEGELPLEEAGIKAEGDKLTITLENPEPYFPKLLTFAPYFGVNQEFVEKAGGKYGTEASLTLSSGPYYAESWARDDKLVFRKNPYYWNAENIKIDVINIYIIPEENTRINMFNNGELDYLEFSGAKKAVVESAGHETFVYENGRSVYLEANLASPIAGNTKLRQALSSAIDRKLFVAGVLKDASKPAEGLTPFGISGAEGKSFREFAGKTLIYDYDPDKAQSLFAEALAEINLEAKDITINLISRNGEPYSTANAALQEIFQNAFGVTVVSEPLDRSSYSARRTDRDYDFCLVSWGADWDDATTFMHYFFTPLVTDYGANVYNNEAFNEPYRKTFHSSSEAERQTELAKAEAVLMQDVPRIPVWSEGQYYAVAPRLKGVHTRAVVPYVDIINADITD